MSLSKSRFIELFGDQIVNPYRWKQSTIGESCILKSGTTLSDTIENEGGPIPYVKVSDMNLNGNEKYIKTSTRFVSYESAKKFLIPKGSIIFPKRGAAISTNKKRITSLPICADLNIMSVFPKEELTSEYIYSYFLNIDLSDLYNGSSVPQINNKDISPLVISIPPLKFQKEYSELVNQIDKSKFLLQKILEKLELLKKSRFIEMFGDVINNKKTWPTKRWSDVLNIVNGKNQKKVECENGIYPICGSGGKIGKTNEYLTKENSVIIGRKGNINNPILMKTKFWNVDTAFGLEPNNKEINVEYLYKFCELFDFQRLNKTVTIPSLTKSDRNCEIFLPFFNFLKNITFWCQSTQENVYGTNKQCSSHRADRKRHYQHNFVFIPDSSQVQFNQDDCR